MCIRDSLCVSLKMPRHSQQFSAAVHPSILSLRLEPFRVALVLNKHVAYIITLFSYFCCCVCRCQTKTGTVEIMTTLIIGANQDFILDMCPNNHNI